MGRMIKHTSPANNIIIAGIVLIFALFLAPQTNQIREDVKGKGLIFDPSELAPPPLKAPGGPPQQGDLPVPLSVDLSHLMPPAGHQGGQNSCVGWSVAYAVKSYQEKIEENRSYFSAGMLDLSQVFSPSFIYNQINDGQNNGSSFKRALDLVLEQGVATWSDMPYNVADILSQPSATARSNASRYRIAGYTRINILDHRVIKFHLNNRTPVIFGAMVDEAFENLGPGETWDSIGETTGGHAMVLVGYDDNRSAFKLLNSWGQIWGDNGFCWVDYSHFRRVARVGYILRDAPNGPPPPPSRGSLHVINLQHNLTDPAKPNQGKRMKFTGTLTVTAGQGKTCQVVIYFYYDLGGGRIGGHVRSLNDYYRDGNGNVACGIPLQKVSAQGLFLTWEAWIPYSVFDIPRGRQVSTPEGMVNEKVKTNLAAVPTLFIDNIQVVKSQPLHFNITF